MSDERKLAPARRGGRPAPQPNGATRTRGEALLYAQRLAKLYPVRRGLWRRPRLLHALNGVSFYVRDRETFGLVGESGSGKSTLGRCVLRLVEPTYGRVIFDGKDVTALSPAELRALRQRMQIVFQDPYSSLDPNMTVAEIVREGIDVFRLAASKREAEARVTELLGQVGLEPSALRRYPHELSGGQRQRIAIARALAVRPDFLVLDEPLSALDPSVQAQIVNLLDELQQQLGLSLLFISHDLRAVQYLAHRLAVLYRGRIMEMGPTEAIARRQHHPYTRALFGALPRQYWTMDERAGAAAHEPAAPEVEMRRGTAHPPSAFEPPPGCPYVACCPRAEPGQCDRHAPDLLETAPRSHHRVACWNPYPELVAETSHDEGPVSAPPPSQRAPAKAAERAPD